MIELLIVIGVVAIIYFASEGSVDTSQWPQAPNDKIMQLATAIAKAEGSNPSYNNPGDIKDTFGYSTNGTFGAGIPIFASISDGVSALYAKLSNIQNGGSSVYPLDETFADMGNSWADGDGNWAVNVARELGVDVNSTLREFFEGQQLSADSVDNSNDFSDSTDEEEA